MRNNKKMVLTLMDIFGQHQLWGIRIFRREKSRPRETLIFMARGGFFRDGCEFHLHGRTERKGKSLWDGSHQEKTKYLSTVQTRTSLNIIMNGQNLNEVDSLQYRRSALG